MKKFLVMVILYSITTSCSKNDKDSPNYSLEKNVIGKWDFSNSAKKNNSCTIYNIVFSTTEFTINYSNGQLKGVYAVDSETQITLSGIGLISNISVSDSNISLNITTDDCTTIASGAKDETYVDGDCTTFLECNSKKMWQRTEEYYEYNYVGFSNETDSVLSYFVNTRPDYGYCREYKVGQNIIFGSAECRGIAADETIQTLTIITHTEFSLVFDINIYDDSCESTFSYVYRYSYVIDAGKLYETIDYNYQLGAGNGGSYYNGSNEYSQSTYSYDSLCSK